jgi:hypothetical protein
MAGVMNSDSFDDLTDKLYTKQISVKVYRTALRRRLQIWDDEDILIMYALGIGHVMVCKAQKVKPLQHISVGSVEAFNECKRRMLPKK